MFVANNLCFPQDLILCNSQTDKEIAEDFRMPSTGMVSDWNSAFNQLVNDRFFIGILFYVYLLCILFHLVKRVWYP